MKRYDPQSSLQISQETLDTKSLSPDPNCNGIDPRKERRAGKETRRGERKCASLLDSAPPDSSDDSGLVLTKPPSRLGRDCRRRLRRKILLHLSLGPPK